MFNWWQVPNFWIIVQYWVKARGNNCRISELAKYFFISLIARSVVFALLIVFAMWRDHVSFVSNQTPSTFIWGIDFPYLLLMLSFLARNMFLNVEPTCVLPLLFFKMISQDYKHFVRWSLSVAAFIFVFRWRELGTVSTIHVIHFSTSVFQHQGLHCICMKKMQPWLYVAMCIHKHLKVYNYWLLGYQATNRNREKKQLLILSCLGWGLNPGPFKSESSALPSELSHLVS